MTSYKPIPLYDEIVWNIITEACHILLLAPSGAGKSMLLSYLAGMVLKRGHNLLLIDAKKTAFGETYKSIGVPVASDVNEIIKMLTELVESMEDDYNNYFSSDEISLDTNFATLKLPAHVLIFDEVLSALESGDKKQKAEMERLLKLLALKGRMAGYIIVLTSQRLLLLICQKQLPNNARHVLSWVQMFLMSYSTLQLEYIKKILLRIMMAVLEKGISSHLKMV